MLSTPSPLAGEGWGEGEMVQAVSLHDGFWYRSHVWH